MTNQNAADNVALIGALKKSRADFVTRLIEASKTDDERILDVFRLDSMYQFAEFFT